jgi:hypothetical protein
MISTMIVGSARTGVDRSMSAQVTTTSGMAEISSVRICAPSIKTVQPRSTSAWSSARNTFALMMGVPHRCGRHQARPTLDELPSLRLARVPCFELGDRARPILLERGPGHRPSCASDGLR